MFICSIRRSNEDNQDLKISKVCTDVSKVGTDVKEMASAQATGFAKILGGLGNLKTPDGKPLFT